MKKTSFIILNCLCFSFSVYPQQKKPKHTKEFSTNNKTITVYTTADNTKLRLTPTDNLKFSPSKQPVETEISVFVEPPKRFQTFMGIGGAITDASAEIFAKLSKEKQTEFLNAYYDTKKGIGYLFSPFLIYKNTRLNQVKQNI